MTTVNEYNAEIKKYNDVTYCDDCRAEILAPWLGHRNVFGFEDICVTDYNMRRFEYVEDLTPNMLTTEELYELASAV